MAGERELTLDEILAGAKDTLARSKRLSNKMSLEALSKTPRAQERPDYRYSDVLGETAASAAPLIASSMAGPVGVAGTGYLALQGIRQFAQDPSLASAVTAGLGVLPGVGALRRAGSAGRVAAIEAAAAASPEARAASTVRDAIRRQDPRRAEVAYRADMPVERTTRPPMRMDRPLGPDLPENVAIQPTRPIEEMAERQLTRGVQSGAPEQFTNPPAGVMESLRGAAIGGAGESAVDVLNPRARAVMEAMFAENNPGFRRMVREGRFGSPGERSVGGGLSRVSPMDDIDEIAERTITRGVQTGRPQDFTDWNPALNVVDEVPGAQGLPAMSEADELIRSMRSNLSSVPTRGRQTPAQAIGEGDEASKRAVMFGGLRPEFSSMRGEGGGRQPMSLKAIRELVARLVGGEG